MSVEEKKICVDYPTCYEENRSIAKKTALCEVREHDEIVRVFTVQKNGRLKKIIFFLNKNNHSQWQNIYVEPENTKSKQCSL